MSPHVVLLGDSIFDNAAYTMGGPDVIRQLRQMLLEGSVASLLAVDGHRTDDVSHQVTELPADATHLILSVGGNDALGHIDILERPAASSAQVLGLLAQVAGDFEDRYRRLVTNLMGRRLPLVLCTIYNGNFPEASYQRLASTALCVFNDAILRVAFERRLGVIDLRLVCSEAADYANSIEPSVAGGSKIARAVVTAVEAMHAPPQGVSYVVAR